MNLTPLQVNAASGLLKNQGLVANTAGTSGYTIYITSDLIKPLVETIAIGNSTNVISSTTVSSLENISSACPPLCNGRGTITIDAPTKQTIYTTLGVVSWRDKLLANIIDGEIQAKPGANMSKCFSLSLTSSDPNVSVSGTITANANCVANCLTVCNELTPLADYINLAVPPPTEIAYTDFDLLACFKNNHTNSPNSTSSTNFTASNDHYPLLIGDFCEVNDKRWKCNCWASAGTKPEFIAELKKLYLGRGDLTIFVQAYNQVQGYIKQSNQFIGGADLGQSYLHNTFNGMSDLITGSISSVNSNIQGFALDLTNLGKLINMNDLEDLGSPLALVRQIINVVGYLPVLSIAFLTVGIPQAAVGAIGSPASNVSDATQKLIYEGLKQINGDALTQMLTVLEVKTTGITTAADLLNPMKLFPTSFKTLKTVTPNGYQPVYVNGQGGVNTSLETELPSYVTRSTA